MRLDHKLILKVVEEGSKVLDLGCGDGTLLALLKEQKQCHVSGIEINEQAIYESMAKGVSVSHGDIDSGLEDYSSKRFDFVILNESLQEVLHPKKVIIEALRVGKKVIVGIPNFCQLISRLQIFFTGRVPRTKGLPYDWYDTPNLRFLSIKDFRDFCHKHDIHIIKETAVLGNRRIAFMRNVLATQGLFLLEKK